jgi:sarcosine oxidase
MAAARRSPVVTDRGTLRAERVVLAAGAWLGELVPALAPRLTVLRQRVGYYRLGQDGAAGRAMPVWARIGLAPDDFAYGLPELVAGEGVKVARHRTSGTADNPDVDPDGADAAALADLDACAHQVLGPRLGARLRVETCLYTMTKDQHFVVDALPGDPRVVIVSACSGHGFKFGPLVGDLVAGLLLDRQRPPPAFALVR